MNDTTRETPAEDNAAKRNAAKRLLMLERDMSDADVRALLAARPMVAHFVRLGRRWGFFATSQSETERARRDILRDANLPESLLACVLQCHADDLPSFEKEVERMRLKDPKSLFWMLLDEEDRLQDEYALRMGTGKLSTKFGRELLAKETDETRYARSLISNPPMPEQCPAWFQVIDLHELAASDLELLFGAFDAGTWNGPRADIDKFAGETNAGIAKIIP